jgi:hypothetical protein
MPWKKTCTMKERELFINEWPGHVTSLTRLCQRFDVSRNTWVTVKYSLDEAKRNPGMLQC